MVLSDNFSLLLVQLKRLCENSCKRIVTIFRRYANDWEVLHLFQYNIVLHELTLLSSESQQWYGDGAGNTVEENSSVFSLIRMR